MVKVWTPFVFSTTNIVFFPLCIKSAQLLR
jgi:hypothetical protein